MSNIVVPQLGESVVEARVARWLKKEGDRVETGEPVVELETDKIDLEVGADHAGVLSSIKHSEGDDVKVGEVLAVVDEADAATAAPRGQQQLRRHRAATDRRPRPQPAAEARARRRPHAASPPSTTIDLERRQRIRSRRPRHETRRPERRRTDQRRQDRTDRRSAIAPTCDARIAPTTRQTAPTSAAGRTDAAASTSERREERVRMSKRRQTIARRLVEAQHTAAMLTTFNEVDMTAVMALRERRKEAFKKQHGVGLGITSFFVKAAVAALRAFPQLNAEIQGDEIVYKHYYDIGIAVGAEGGLVVPVLRNADRMSFAADRARDSRLRDARRRRHADARRSDGRHVHDHQRRRLRVAAEHADPESAAGRRSSGLHKIQDRAVPLNGQVVIRPMMYVALSYDHRMVDGREAVQFLVRIKELVEDPANLLLVS